MESIEKITVLKCLINSQGHYDLILCLTDPLVPFLRNGKTIVKIFQYWGTTSMRLFFLYVPLRNYFDILCQTAHGKLFKKKHVNIVFYSFFNATPLPSNFFEKNSV